MTQDEVRRGVEATAIEFLLTPSPLLSLLCIAGMIMCAEPSFWNWKPLESVGPSRLGARARPLMDRYGLESFDPSFADGSTIYKCSTRKVLLGVSRGRVEDVGCYEELFYKVTDLLTCSIDEIFEMLGPPDRGEDIDDGLRRFEFDQLNAQLWARGERVGNVWVYHCDERPSVDAMD